VSDIDRLIDEAVRTPFTGWDFSWLEGRADDGRPPWNYHAEIAATLADDRTVLDVDTGGGEVLARHLPARARVVATEGYAPNIPVAAATLRPLGALVVGTESAPDNVEQAATDPRATSSHLPFRDETFDAVLDRHSSYWPAEIARVLRPGGTFVTQQRGVGGAELLALFGREIDDGPAFDLAFAAGQLRDAGLDVIRAEGASAPIVFKDVGAFVYFVRAVPWVLPEFDVVADRPALERVDDMIGRDGAFEVSGEHMLLIARKPAGGGR
jgi:SAM-dependent methyltransferase